MYSVCNITSELGRVRKNLSVGGRLSSMETKFPPTSEKVLRMSSTGTSVLKPDPPVLSPLITRTCPYWNSITSERTPSLRTPSSCFKGPPIRDPPRTPPRGNPRPRTHSGPRKRPLVVSTSVPPLISTKVLGLALDPAHPSTRQTGPS